LPVAKPDAAKRGPKPCPFCGIVSGDQKSFLVFDDALSVAFLDYRPLLPGHVLLVPRAHYETLADTPDDVMAALGVRVKRLSAGIMKAMDAEGIFVALNNVVSQSVPHVHFHIVPRRKGDGLFSAGMIWKRVAYRSDEERESIAARIRAAIAEGAA
jgi:histidine triad (HIT) family protein